MLDLYVRAVQYSGNLTWAAELLPHAQALANHVVADIESYTLLLDHSVQVTCIALSQTPSGTHLDILSYSYQSSINPSTAGATTAPGFIIIADAAMGMIAPTQPDWLLAPAV